MRRVSTLAKLIISGVMLLSAFIVVSCHKKIDYVKAACELARLSPLPANSTVTNMGGTSNPFSGTSRFCFTAQKQDIQSWLESSPGIKDAEEVKINADHVLLVVRSPEDLTDNGLPAGEYEILMVPANAPWFAPSIKNGWKYDIPQDSHANYGYVYVNDDTGEVCVSASHS